MVNFESICGYDAIKRELVQLAAFLREPGRYQRNGARMPSGLLIVGQPGLGKTLMAQVLMRESGLAAFTCRKTARGEDMLKAIRHSFDRARESVPSVLLLDDLDKFSNCDYDLCDTEEYVTVQSCIDECKGKGVFVIATANDPDKLPKSLLRAGRFDRTIALDPPCGADAVAIVGHYLQGVPCDESVTVERVSGILEGTPCALIETTVNEAALLAGFEGSDRLALAHFVRAYAKAQGNGTLAALPEGEPERIEDAWGSPRAQVAFHEAGHFVMRESLREGGSSLAVILERQGSLSGFSKDRHPAPCVTAAEARDAILVALAGALAVERQYGVPCLGCSSDNREALELVSDLVGDAGSLGRYFTGTRRWSGSEALGDARERACAVLLEQFRWEARAILAREWRRVEAIAARLYRDGYVLASGLDASESAV